MIADGMAYIKYSSFEIGKELLKWMERRELQFPDQAIPRSKALEKLSLASSERIIEMASDTNIVVDAIVEKRKPKMAFISMNENKIMRGYG